MESPVRDKALTQVERIGTTTTRISKIVSGLRSFSRSGEEDPFVAVSLRTIIDETLDLCRERFKNAGIELRVSDIPAVLISCRAVQIQQVLINLLNNAFDAILTSDSKWVMLEAKTNENILYLRVTDSGTGIPQEIVNKMMQPFFTTKDIGKGTGLGLSIALGIIHGHGGSLCFDRGHTNTSFVIEIPIKSEELT